MKFSLFYEMQISDPTRDSEAQLFHDCLEQAVLADELGYHCVWEVEHHGLYEYSHSSAPGDLPRPSSPRGRSGSASATACTLLPHRYNHPIRIAERIATLDILSGRARQLGLGQVVVARRAGRVRERRHDAARAVARGARDDPAHVAAGRVPHKGRFFDIPPTQVVPKPVQTAAPADVRGLLQAGDRPRRRHAGPRRAQLRHRHRRLPRPRRSPSTAPRWPRPAAVGGKNNHFACTPADARAAPTTARPASYGLRGARFFAESLARYYFAGTRPIGQLDVPRDFLRRRRPRRRDGVPRNAEVAASATHHRRSRLRARDRCSASSTSASTS